jgi:hypothetical protein
MASGVALTSDEARLPVREPAGAFRKAVFATRSETLPAQPPFLLSFFLSSCEMLASTSA